MYHLIIEFQEEYKRLDRLCKDYLRSAEGVSEYIRQMESTDYRQRFYVRTWEEDYKQLKHVRWVRNQLAHEVGTSNSGVCTEEDLIWIENFYSRIINGNDPFSIIVKAKKDEEQKRKQRSQNQTQSSVQPSPKRSATTTEKPSFLIRLIASVKKFFFIS